MKDNAIGILLGLNILVTGGIGALLLTKFAPQEPAAGGLPQETITVDLSGLEKPLTKVSSDLDGLTETIQRFNTSLVQYDFLKREMDRLAIVDQTIGVRAQATAAAKTDENAEQVEETMEKLGVLSKQVKQQQETRRQTMLKLISGLEQQLAAIPQPPVKEAPEQPEAEVGDVEGE